MRQLPYFASSKELWFRSNVRIFVLYWQPGFDSSLLQKSVTKRNHVIAMLGTFPRLRIRGFLIKFKLFSRPIKKRRKSAIKSDQKTMASCDWLTRSPGRPRSNFRKPKLNFEFWIYFLRPMSPTSIRWSLRFGSSSLHFSFFAPPNPSKKPLLPPWWIESS